MTFTEGFSKLSYNVTAVAQSDAQGYGPGYLLNGLTNAGYWYQVGVAFNWPYQQGGYDVGFNFLYEAFNGSGASIYPSGGGGGVGNFSGPVNYGDLVLLQLSISGDRVAFAAHDWDTRAAANQSFPAFGSGFVGLTHSSGANGFFSGLMTEWYHVNPYYGSEAEVRYSNSTTGLSSATLWVDEFNANSSTSLFGSSQTYAFSSPDRLRPFSLGNATEYANAYSFITGSLGRTLITLSYSVVAGGAANGPPLLSYIENGTSQTSAIARTPTTYLADSGSLWQVSPSLPGSSATVRWETSQVTNGTLITNVNESLLYFHQYLSTLTYTVSGGSGFSPPQWSGTSFGSPLSLSGNASAWVDAASSLGFPSTLAGSNSSERWATQSSNLTITGARSVHVVYEHQYSPTAGTDPGRGGSVSLTPPWAAAGSSVQLSEHPEAGWKFEGWSGSGDGSYSGPLSTASVIASGPISENATFYPGLTIDAASNGEVVYSSSDANGTVSPQGSEIIYSAIGTTVTLRAVPSSFLYTFAGWIPSAGGDTLSLTLTSPETVTAEFKLSPLPIIAAASTLLVVAAGVSFLALRRKRRVLQPPTL
jgi:hypothetical protein